MLEVVDDHVREQLGALIAFPEQLNLLLLILNLRIVGCAFVVVVIFV